MICVALVAVLQFSYRYSHTLKILLYLYINIELIFNHLIIYFGTATLQRCNSELYVLLIKTTTPIQGTGLIHAKTLRHCDSTRYFPSQLLHFSIFLITFAEIKYKHHE